MKYVSLLLMTSASGIAAQAQDLPFPPPKIPVVGREQAAPAMPIVRMPRSTQPVINLGDVVTNVVIAKVVSNADGLELAIAKFGRQETAQEPSSNVTFVTETRTKTVMENGQAKEVQYTVTIPVVTEASANAGTANRFVPNELDRTIPVKFVQAFDLKGNKLEKDAWIKQLEQPKHILLVREPLNESNRLNPFFSALLKEDTLLLFLAPQPKLPDPEKRSE